MIKLAARATIFICLLCLPMMTIGCQSLGGAAYTQAVSRPAHPSFVTREQLTAALARSEEGESTRPRLSGHQFSGVVPHHLTAGHMIAGYFAGLVPQHPDLLILVGPNHDNRGGKVITGYYSWQTPTGLVSTEEEAVKHLIDQGLAVRDDVTLASEHSIGNLMPFISHYLPRTKVVPLIFHHDVTLEEVDRLLQGLKPYLRQGTVLVASVDFSHYLTRRKAEAKDIATLSYMQRFDYSTLFRLGDDHLDSPASLASAFRLAEMRGIKKFTVLDHNNSGNIMNNDLMETTSYFSLAFTDNADA